MNDQLQTQLADVLDIIRAAVASASDFALAQLPDIAQQYLLFGRAYATAFFLLYLVTLAVSLKVALWGWKGANAPGSEHLDAPFAAMFFGTGGFILSVLAAGFAIRPLLLVWLAPKVWLLEKLAALS